jgi:hypothetical protein
MLKKLTVNTNKTNKEMEERAAYGCAFRDCKPLCGTADMIVSTLSWVLQEG